MGWWEPPDYKDQDCYSATTLAQGLARQALKKAQRHATFFTLALLAALSTAELFLFLLLCLFFLLLLFAFFFRVLLLSNRNYFWFPQPYSIISP